MVWPDRPRVFATEYSRFWLFFSVSLWLPRSPKTSLPLEMYSSSAECVSRNLYAS